MHTLDIHGLFIDFDFVGLIHPARLRAVGETVQQWLLTMYLGRYVP